MAKLTALIFDVDGTIAETERDGHRVAFNQAFVEAGLDWEWSEAFYGKLLHVPGGKERMQHYWDEYEPQFDPAGADRDWLLHVHDRKNHFYKQRVEQGKIPLRPGVKRLINEARSQGIKLAIATTSAVPNAMALIKRSFDPDWFEVIAAGEMVDNKKPAPDVYLYALEKLQIDPKQCVAFEDSGAGLKAAIAAELCTVVTQNEYTRNHDFSGACRVLNHLGESDQPVTVVQGEPLEGDYFTLETARSLLTHD